MSAERENTGRMSRRQLLQAGAVGMAVIAADRLLGACAPPTTPRVDSTLQRTIDGIKGPVTAVTIGDSITAGWGVRNAKEADPLNAWPKIVERMLNTRRTASNRITIDNSLSRFGSPIEQPSPFAPPMVQIIDNWHPAKQPDMVVLASSINEINAATGSSVTARQGIERAYDTLTARGIGQVLVAYMMPMAATNPSSAKLSEVNDYNLWLAFQTDRPADRRIPTLPMAAILKESRNGFTREDLVTDTLHLNLTGQTEYAKLQALPIARALAGAA